MRAATPNREGPENRTLDAWLQREFVRRYDGALQEPLPQEWLALLTPTQ